MLVRLQKCALLYIMFNYSFLGDNIKHKNIKIPVNESLKIINSLISKLMNWR